MKKFQVFALAALTAFGLSGCTKEITGGNDGDGAQAQMSLTIKLPGADVTRATTDSPKAATQEESSIANVSLWIFKANGTAMAIADGGYKHIPFDAHSANPTWTTNADGTYTYKETIATKAETGARLYLAANLGDVSGWNIADEASLLAQFDATSTTYAYSATATSGSFKMFAPVETKTLVPSEQGDNPVSFTLSRVTAKVSVTSALTISKTINTSLGGLTLAYSFDTYRPYNTAKQTFIAPNFLPDNAALAGTPGYGGIVADIAAGRKIAFYNTYSPYLGGAKGAAYEMSTLHSDTEIHGMYPGLNSAAPTDGGQRAVKAHTGNVTTVNTLPGYYIGENRDYWLPAANKAVTYVMVGTKVGASSAAEWDGANNTVKYVPGTPYGNGNTDIYILRFRKTGQADQHFVTNTTAKRTLIRQGMIDAGLAVASELVEFTYPKGWVHFPVYLDRYYGTHVDNRYGIFRNDFLHVNVTDIKVGEGGFPGYPGNSTWPDEPIDIETDTPENPDPKDPDKPVDGSPALLEVTIEVADWNYMTQNTELQ